MQKLLFTLLFLTISLYAKVHVATTYTYLGKITERIGGDAVHVDILANPKMDPHFITPKPSLIGKLRREDLLIINGGQLEIGWLPPLLKSANNANIHPGAEGFLDVSGVVDMIDKPESVSRAYGDIHPDGNPHFATDPHNILPIAALIAKKLAQIDPAHASQYEENFKKFQKSFTAFVAKIDQKMQPCRGKKVVQYHELFNYFLQRYGIENVGNIEPLPGITPSSKHTMELIRKMRQEGVTMILQDLYHEKKTAQFIAAKTGAHVVVIPHDVGAMEGTQTLESFYETIANRLCQP